MFSGAGTSSMAIIESSWLPRKETNVFAIKRIRTAKDNLDKALTEFDETMEKIFEKQSELETKIMALEEALKDDSIKIVRSATKVIVDTIGEKREMCIRIDEKKTFLKFLKEIQK